MWQRKDKAKLQVIHMQHWDGHELGNDDARADQQEIR